jgi:hypothetical protein
MKLERPKLHTVRVIVRDKTEGKVKAKSFTIYETNLDEVYHILCKAIQDYVMKGGKK